MAHARRKEESTRGNYRRELKPLSCGDIVCVQNQHGNHPLRWNATGTMADCLPHRQYKVLEYGSRRITLRNRRFLRQTGDSTHDTFDDKPNLTAMPPIAIKETALWEYVIPDKEVQQIKPPVSENIIEPETMERESPIRELRRSTRDHRLPQRYGNSVAH